MKPVSDIRRQRLAQLVTEHGSQVAVAQRIGKDKNQVYQWLLPAEAAGARNIGPRSARLIEVKCGLRHGWMDHEPEPDSGSGEPLTNSLIPQSYAARLDPAILADALKAVAIDEAIYGAYSFLKRASLLIEMYQRIESGEEVAALAAKLAKPNQQGPESNERAEPVSAGGGTR